MNFMNTLKCTICGSEYTPKRMRKNLKFCSVKCKDRAIVQKRKREGYQTGPCVVKGCTRQSRWKFGGPCSMHYSRIRLTGTAGSSDTQYGKRMGQLPCEVDGCDRKYFSKGLCNMHYNRKRLTGDAGEAAPRRGIRPPGEYLP
jgi:hypothetical protein